MCAARLMYDFTRLVTRITISRNIVGNREEQLGFDDRPSGAAAIRVYVCAHANCVTVGTIGAPVYGRYTSSTCSPATATGGSREARC